MTKISAITGALTGVLISLGLTTQSGELLGDWIYKAGIIGALIFIATQSYCSFKLVNSENPRWLSNILWFAACLPVTIFSYAKLYQAEGILSDGALVHEFESALYFSVVTFTTLGYGDFQPTKELRLWAASEAFLGYILLGMFIALVLNFLSKLR